MFEPSRFKFPLGREVYPVERREGPAGSQELKGSNDVRTVLFDIHAGMGRLSDKSRDLRVISVENCSNIDSALYL